MNRNLTVNCRIIAILCLVAAFASANDASAASWIDTLDARIGHYMLPFATTPIEEWFDSMPTVFKVFLVVIAFRAIYEMINRNG